MFPRQVTRAGTAVLAATAAMVMVGSCTASAATNPATSRATSPRAAASERFHLPPVVQRTGTRPTGYAVSFRYWAPSATAVKLTGEWSFTSPAHTTTTTSQALPPSQWAPGDFPIVHPNTLQGHWPVIKITMNDTTGVWSATVPLPSGVFTYGFLVDCRAATNGSGCTEVPDPSNMAWNTRGRVTRGSAETDSQVFVPSDPAFKTVNYSWQAPNPTHGSLINLAYPSSAARDALKANRLAIYTPPGYSANRTPYPTLYLSHGYGGNEVDWSTTGDAASILDNLIDSGQVKPMIVVMTNFNGFADNCIANEPAWTAEYDDDLINNVIPFVEAHYDVSGTAARRAFAGVSCGGGLAISLLVGHLGEFGSYGIMSPYQSGWTDLTPAVRAQVIAYFAARRGALNQVGLFLGGGRQDPIHAIAAAEGAILDRAGINVDRAFINGGHEWFVWRILLRDFLTDTAFQPAAQ